MDEREGEKDKCRGRVDEREGEKDKCRGREVGEGGGER